MSADLENAAWATVAIPYSAEQLSSFLQNIERLFRLNPHLEIRHWSEAPTELVVGKQIQFEALNEMNGVFYDTTLILAELETLHLQITYSSSFKQSLDATIGSPAAGSSTLTLIERYRLLPPAEHAQHLHEVDQGLSVWGVAIRQYIVGMRRWSWFWPYRWYKESFWLKMTPRHRRISRLILWTTLLEFIVFIFVFIIYWLEAARKLTIN